MSYQAIVAKANVYEHPNADNLQLANVNGYTIVVGKNVQDGELGILFPPDGQISPEFAEANDLIGYTDPDTGKRCGGFFAKNRRVRSQRLRGEKSEGFWTTLDSVSFIEGLSGLPLPELKEGDKFDTLNGIPICNKYFTPATIKAMGQQKTQKKNKCFPKHVETEKLQYEVNSIPEGSLIYITEKLHGTSGRYSFVLDEQELPKTLFQKLFRRPAKKDSSYKVLTGTRNLILNNTNVESFYGAEGFRYNIVNKFKNLSGETVLRKGEVIYGEIVGYTDTGASIMGQHDTSELKEIKKKYGPKMEYKYGEITGNCEFYVYRIIQVNEDGEYVELPWSQVKARCKELAIKFVPEMYPPFIYDKQDLIGIADSLMEGESTLDNSHIREGVVFRVEDPNGHTNFYKSKSFTFGVLEGYLKSGDEFIDREEVS